MASNIGGNAAEDAELESIRNFAEITQTDEAFAHYMLQENEYDLNRALTSFFNSQAPPQLTTKKSPVKVETAAIDSQAPPQLTTKKSPVKVETAAIDVDEIPPIPEEKVDNETEGNKNETASSASSFTSAVTTVVGTSAKRPHEEGIGNNIPKKVNEPREKRAREADELLEELKEDAFSKDLTLISWNIDGLDERNVQKRFTAALCVIAKTNPEVIFLQEMVPELMPQIEKLLCPMYNMFIQKSLLNYSCVTLVSKNIQITHSQDIPFENTSMGRGMLIVEGEWQRLKLKLLNSHLESVKENSAVRKTQFKQCIERMIFMTAANPAETLAIFGGDLNIRDEETCDLPLAIKDAWVDDGSNVQHKYTWDLSRNDNYADKFGRARPRCRFDRIYFAGPCKSVKFQLEGTQRIRGINCFPSDHFAVVCRFFLNKYKDDTEEDIAQNGPQSAANKSQTHTNDKSAGTTHKK